MLLTHSYIRKNGGEVPGQGAVRACWKQGSRDLRSVDIHLVASPYCHWWRDSWTGLGQSELEVGRLRAVGHRSSYSFPSNKYVNVSACMHYKKYPSRIMIFSIACTHPYINNYIKPTYRKSGNACTKFRLGIFIYKGTSQPSEI